METSKTISEWLSELPPSIAAKARKNAKDCERSFAFDVMNDVRPNLQKALLNAFVFDDTEEGWDFWRGVANESLKDKPDYTQFED